MSKKFDEFIKKNEHLIDLLIDTKDTFGKNKDWYRGAIISALYIMFEDGQYPYADVVNEGGIMPL